MTDIKTELINMLYMMACSAQAFALVSGNLILLGQTKYTLTQLRRLTDEGIVPFADGIMAAVQPYIALMGPYNWKEEDMIALTAKKDEYAAFLGVPRDQKAIKESFTQ